MSHGRRTLKHVLVFVSMITAFATVTSAGEFDPLIRKKVADARLCATVEFEFLRVYANTGIVEKKASKSHRVRAGDPIIPTDVDLREKGHEVQIEFMSPSTGNKTVDVYIFLENNMKKWAPERELANWPELEKGLAYFTKPCESQGEED